MRILHLNLLFFIFGTLFSPLVFAQELTLAKAVALASQNDPALAHIEATAKALDEKSISDKQLPDPKASLAFQNFPTDNFSRSREGMTQIVFGASQVFPRGKTLAHKSRKTKSMADNKRAQFEEEELNIKQSVRKAWLDLYYWEQAATTLNRSEALLKKVISATETRYSTGRSNNQDIISAELELSVLQDKKIDVNSKIETARAELAKWIGQEAARKNLSATFPKLPSLMAYEALENGLVNHPRIQAAEAIVKAGKHGVMIAQEQYKPGFNVGLNYGIRDGNLPDGDSRPDFVTAKLSFDVPFFTGNRQDRKLGASRYEAASAQYKRNDTLRNLKAMLEKDFSNWQRFSERVRHYETSVLKQAAESFETSLQAYQEDKTDFSSLIRAQVRELDANLQWIKLKTNAAKAHSSLLYLQGEK